jgi:ABC-type uncharacterized transport system permease subunit
MLAGAFTAAAMTYASGSPWMGLVAAIGAGLLIALIHAVACIRYRADQVVVGTAINILMIGLPGFLSGAFFLSSGSTPQLPIDQLLPRAPIVMAFAFVPLTWYVLYRTPLACAFAPSARIPVLRMPPDSTSPGSDTAPFCCRARLPRWGARISQSASRRCSRAT